MIFVAIRVSRLRRDGVEERFICAEAAAARRRRADGSENAGMSNLQRR